MYRKYGIAIDLMKNLCWCIFVFQESKKRFDEDEKFKAHAHDCVVKLQSYDADFVKAWQMICDVSRKDFTRIYDRLDIRIIERGESFYRNMMADVVRELDEKGFVYDLFFFLIFHLRRLGHGVGQESYQYLPTLLLYLHERGHANLPLFVLSPLFMRPSKLAILLPAPSLGHLIVEFIRPKVMRTLPIEEG